jgi:hypothetical protein
MEDASAEDLDWFWRGWFYGTEPCDISLDSVKTFKADILTNPEKMGITILESVDKPAASDDFDDISKIRNRNDKEIVFAVDADTSLRDFYWNYARGLVKVDTTPYEVKNIQFEDTLTQAAKQVLAANKNFYELHLSNKGGLVMPLIIEWTFKDGSKEIDKISAQIWRKNENNVTRVFVKDKEVANIKLDPLRETADIDEKNNSWPVKEIASRFQLYKAKQNARGQSAGSNPMQKQVK